MSYIDDYLNEAIDILKKIDRGQMEKMIQLLLTIREQRGRLFFLGVGGSAGNASHAVNDFRKIADFEAYTPADNVSELMARTNDEGWDTVFIEWLKGSRLRKEDGVVIFSVGGGNSDKNISKNLVLALKYAKSVNAKILGIVGRDGGFTAKVADACLIVPTVNPDTVTPHTEAFQAVLWHLMVSDPRIKRVENKWESLK
ncbi:MAG: SIS domain-containing protein [Candidatus Aminicenantes bacterium]|nr:SIS domain-containing protein [Candidatus Aminicenantes bacterium]